MAIDAIHDLDVHLRRFNLPSFRPGQREVIETVLSGRDCLCVMPTGGGKSLCYQLPAIAREGLTLVVSPLIALMKDQVDQLSRLGLPVTYINSTLPLGEQQARLDGIAAGRYKLAYVVPERFRSSRFLEAVQSVRLNLLAVDEAHCISEWGHDFRPDYARLGQFRRRLGKPTTIALTATATDAVRRDIVEQLDLDDPRTFITGFARPNLFYEVKSPRGERQKVEMLLEFLRRTPGSGIIYAATRRRTEEIAQTVAQSTRRRTAPYHAGLLPDQRRQAQEAFMQGRVEIVVATTAFGMGIDKADVRFVVHYNLPGTLEAYYQEAGRAGRDGKPSRCMLLYSASDRFIQEYFIESAYPSREYVAAVYDYLRDIDEEPIERTQQDIKEQLGLPIGAEGVGTCEQLLESAGVLERLIASQNMASVRLDSELPTLVDMLPQRATVRRRVLRAVEKLVGNRRNEMVHFQPRRLLEMTELDQPSLSHALRELGSLGPFTYVPPFRGRAIRMIRRDVEFDDVEIDFPTLERRKQAEFNKLNRVIRYALDGRCRQATILRYFGDRAPERCGHCDNCGSGAAQAPPTSADGGEALDPHVLEAVRIALSGVARIDTETPVSCGKVLVAQMLCGSNNQRMQRLGLDRLSTYGLLGHLTQTQAIDLLDSLIAAELLRQVELDVRRPVVQLTPLGREVMTDKCPLPPGVPLPAALSAKLRRGRPGHERKPESGTGEAEPADADERMGTKESSAAPDQELSSEDRPLIEGLKQWRTSVCRTAGVPAYRVLTNATIEHLARQRPRTLDDLLEVHGIGEQKVGKYGGAILETVARILGWPVEVAPPAAEPLQDAESGASEIPPPPAGHGRVAVGHGPAGGTRLIGGECPTSEDEKPSYHWTYRLLAAGFPPEQCAAIRGLTLEDIWREAVEAVDAGLPVRRRWLFSAEKLATLEAVAGSVDNADIEPALSRLPDGVRPAEVRLYLKCHPPKGRG